MTSTLEDSCDEWERRSNADRLEKSGPPCAVCGHPFGAHGDRAVVACCTPTLSPRYTVVFCHCVGWQS